MFGRGADALPGSESGLGEFCRDGTRRARGALRRGGSLSLSAANGLELLRFFPIELIPRCSRSAFSADLRARSRLAACCARSTVSRAIASAVPGAPGYRSYIKAYRSALLAESSSISTCGAGIVVTITSVVCAGVSVASGLGDLTACDLRDNGMMDRGQCGLCVHVQGHELRAAAENVSSSLNSTVWALESPTPLALHGDVGARRDAEQCCCAVYCPVDSLVRTPRSVHM